MTIQEFCKNNYYAKVALRLLKESGDFRDIKKRDLFKDGIEEILNDEGYRLPCQLAMMTLGEGKRTEYMKLIIDRHVEDIIKLMQSYNISLINKDEIKEKILGYRIINYMFDNFPSIHNNSTTTLNRILRKHFFNL